MRFAPPQHQKNVAGIIDEILEKLSGKDVHAFTYLRSEGNAVL
jgi:hypothetical protein